MKLDLGSREVTADILIVEESPNQAMRLQLFLEDSGFHTSAVIGGEGALAFLEKHKPRIVLSNAVMPQMDGFELCRRIRTNKALDGLPVVLISRLSDPEEIKKGLESGAHAFIVKPYRKQALLRQISATLLVEETARAVAEDKNGFQQMNLVIGGNSCFVSSTEWKTHRDRLEEIVEERTNELVTANIRLKREIREREELRTQVVHSQKLESIGTLAGGVAHEINNPINGILNYAQLIKDKAAAGSDSYEFASEIVVETERVANIVRNLLTFARQDKQAHSPARMQDIINGATTLIRTIIRGDMIELDVDVPDDLPELKCRSQQIQQVIMNLLTNARDAMDSRYKEYDKNKIIRVEARVFEKEGRRWIRATVEDHGTGIPEEVRERIFDPFYTTKERSKGTGLGLSISHGIVEDHHGELTVESVVNEYTRFTLDLPVDNGWKLEQTAGEK